MIVLECLDSLTINSMWMLDPPIHYLLPELSRRGYTVIGMLPQTPIMLQSFMPLPPNVIAFKAFTRIVYDPSRRVLGVEGVNEDDVYRSFEELEEVLKNIGGDLKRNAIFYEFIARGRARGCKLYSEDIEISLPIELKLATLPLSFVKKDSSPSDKEWFSIELRPIWTSWSSENIYYEIFAVYRGERDEVLRFLRYTRSSITEALKTISEKFCAKQCI